jgi:hypothetical protein
MLKLPYIDNPLFRFESRRLRWGASPEQVWRASKIITASVLVGVFALWFLLAQINRQGIRITSQNQPGGQQGIQTSPQGGVPQSGVTYPPRGRESFDFFNGLLLVSISASIVLDLACLTVSMSFNGRDSQAEDLLRLTTLSSKARMSAKYAIDQIRVWWIMWLVVSLRAAAILFFMVMTPGLTAGFGRGFGFGSPFRYYGFLLPLLVPASAFLIEPIWRMRAMTALGLGISVQVPKKFSAALVGVLADLGIWVVQILLVAGIGGAVPIFGLGRGFPRYEYSNSLMGMVLEWLLIAGTWFAFLWVIQKSSLQTAIARWARDD